MTRKRFKKLVMAFSIRINEKVGSHVTGDLLRKQRDNDFAKILKEHGSYQAAWDWMKPARDAFGMD